MMSFCVGSSSFNGGSILGTRICPEIGHKSSQLSELSLLLELFRAEGYIAVEPGRPKRGTRGREKWRLYTGINGRINRRKKREKEE
jgi:hypothetical protein